MTDQPTPHESAQEMLAFMEHLYGQQHVFEQVDRRNFPHLDQKFYQKTQQELRRLGFRHIAD
ncbi:MAG: hypothetical protein F6K09_37920, partial [Merismopedia sp. SIO2A8]|nr:hypothetical protein [Merismopedia sp. SIO2A8]